MQVSRAFGDGAMAARDITALEANTYVSHEGTDRAAIRTADASVASGHFASVPSTAPSAALRVLYADTSTPTATHEDYVVQRIPEMKRRMTTIEDVEMLFESKGPYSQLPVIRKVQGKWDTAGPGERARPHYDKWQADASNRLLEEHYYDALYHDLGGLFLDLVEDTIKDWKKTGRFERQVYVRTFYNPDYDASRAERDMRESMQAWYVSGPALEHFCLWKLAGEGDHHSRQLSAVRPDIGKMAPMFMMERWESWHNWGRPRQHHLDPTDEMRILHKKLIVKQILDVALARETAYINASEPS